MRDNKGGYIGDVHTSTCPLQPVGREAEGSSGGPKK